MEFVIFVALVGLVWFLIWTLTKLKNRIHRETFEHQLALNLRAGSSLLGLSVQVNFEALMVKADSYQPRNAIFGRFTVPLARKTGLRLLVAPRTSRIQPDSYLDLKEIKFGDRRLDDRYAVWGNDETRVRSLLANKAIREPFDTESNLRLEIKEDRDWLGSSPSESTEQLCLTAEGLVTNSYQLQSIYALLGELLQLLDLPAMTAVPIAQLAATTTAIRESQPTIEAEAPLAVGAHEAKPTAQPPEPEEPVPQPATAIPPVGPPTAAGARLIVLEGALQGKEFVLTREAVTVGRSIACEVTINDQKLSYEHARIVRGEAGWEIQDMMGSDGTYLNGERLAAPRPLRDGDVITLGDTRLAFHGAES